MFTGITVRRMAVCGAIALAALTVSGCFARSADQVASSGSSTAGRSAVAPAEKDPGMARDAIQPSAENQASVPSAQVGGVVEPLIISTMGISLEVTDLEASLSKVRTIASARGASISNLSMQAGGDIGIRPEPLEGAVTAASSPSPASAVIQLRVPASNLAATERDVAKLGRVLSEQASQDDVTQQHVDLSARLRNLKAEEARLRTFFGQAKRVSEMLAIEQELSRVRGEIESLQAQVDYLERQASLATLTVSLSEPGSLVSPAGGGWGFAEAVRQGVRAAASLLTATITALIALSPVIALAVILWLVVRSFVRRRRARRAEHQSGPHVDDTENGPIA